MAWPDGTRPRIGVIGTGWWATRAHIPSLVSYPRGHLVALADADPERLAAASTHFGVEQTFTSVEDLLAAGEIHGLIVALPHREHYRVARAALEAGVHVLVEKPLTLRAADAWDLVRLAEQRRLHLVVGLTHQYTASARRCREVIQSGGIGELLLVAGEYNSVTHAFYRGQVEAYEGELAETLTRPRRETYADPNVAGGGQGQTQLTHAVGMVMWVTGQPAEQVFALMHHHGLAVDVVTVLSARLRGGGALSLSSTGNLRPEQPVQKVLHYYGTSGSVIQDLQAGTLEIYHGDGRHERVGGDDHGEIEPALRPARVLVDLIAGRGENPAPGPAGAHTVECIEAAYRSHQLGRPVLVDKLEAVSL